MKRFLTFAHLGFLTFATQVLSMCPALIGCHLFVHVISITALLVSLEHAETVTDETAGA